MSGNTQAIAVSPTEIYVGGHFAGFNQPSVNRPYLASINPATGAATSWDPKASGQKSASGDRDRRQHAHVGGLFTHFNGVQQRLYAQFAGPPTPCSAHVDLRRCRRAS